MLVVAGCLNATYANADDGACEEFYEEGYRLTETIRLTFPNEEGNLAGEPMRIGIESTSGTSDEGYLLVFVATADTLFISDSGQRDPDIAFASEWNRYAMGDLHGGAQALQVVPPKAGPFGLSYALVAARRGCEEKLLSSVGKKVFQIEDQAAVSAQMRCLGGSPDGGALPRVAVNVDAGPDRRVRAGRMVGVSWALDGDLPGRCTANPLYLMFSFSGGVRFSGEGFMALPPGAPGPYGIAGDGDRTRLFVPLAGPGSAPGVERTEGGFSFSVLEVGGMDMGWSVVEVPRLRDRPFFKEDYAAQDHPVRNIEKEYRLEASVGEPDVYVQDMYSLAQPDSVVRSANGEYTMQIFDGWYRLIDSGSRNIILERDGRDPRFSPTSRFLTAVFEDGYAVEIVDILAGKSVYKSSTSTTRTANIDTISWSKGDAFALVEMDGGSQFEEDLVIVSSVVDGRIHEYSPYSESGALGGPPLSVVIDTDQAAIYGLEGATRKILDPIPLTSRSSYHHYDATGSADHIDADRLVGSRATSAAYCGDWRIVHGATSGPMTVAYGAPEDIEATAPECPGMATNVAVDDGADALPGGVNDDTGANGAPVVQRAAFSLAAASSEPDVAVGRNRIGARIADLVGVEVGSAVHGEGILFNEDLLPKEEGENFEDDMMLWADMRKWREVGLDRVLDAQTSPYDFLHCPGGKDAGINPDHIMYARRWDQGGKSAWIVGTRCFTGSGAGVNNGGLYFITETDDGRYRSHLFGSEFEEEGFGETFGPMDQQSSPDSYYRQVAAAFGYINSYEDMYASKLDDRHLAFVTPSLDFGVFDMREARIKWIGKVTEIGGPVGSISLDGSGENIFAVGENGVISVFKSADGRKILNGQYLDDELALYDPDGYYIATPEAGHFVYLSFDGLPDRYTVNQFRSALYRPDHIRAVLAGDAERLEPPVLTAPPSLRMTVAPGYRAGVMKVNVRAASTNPLAGITLSVDGKQVLDREFDGNSIDFTKDLTLDSSARWITALARDAERLESVPVTVSVAYEDPRPSGRLFALGIGTDTYTSPRLPKLNYAATDARNFVEMAGNASGRYYADVETELMLESEDLSAQMTRWIEHIGETATAGDTVMILAAGHGLRDDNGAFFLADRNTDVDDLANTGASWSQIAHALAGLKARVFVFVDACHSGAVEFSGANDGAVESIIRQDGRVAVIAASKGRQFSQEKSSLRGGVFTSSLARIVGEAREETDANRNGALELSEIYGAVKRQVVTLTDGEQTPWIARNEMIGEVPLF